MAKKTDSSEIAVGRRELLQVSLGLFGAVPLCCRTDEIPSASISYRTGALLIDLEKSPALGTVGAAGAVVDAVRKLNLIVVHTAKNSFVVLDRSCTHGGAQCTYNSRRHTLRCTSLNHAEYDLNGTLLHGRTHGNLRAYPARRVGNLVEISLERSV